MFAQIQAPQLLFFVNPQTQGDPDQQEQKEGYGKAGGAIGGHADELREKGMLGAEILSFYC